jgi:hypothetical protein
VGAAIAAGVMSGAVADLSAKAAGHRPELDLLCDGMRQDEGRCQGEDPVSAALVNNRTAALLVFNPLGWRCAGALSHIPPCLMVAFDTSGHSSPIC